MNDLMTSTDLDDTAILSTQIRLLAGRRPPPGPVNGLSEQAALIWGRARPPFPADLWCIETDGPDPLDHRGAALRAWQRAPWALRVRLARYEAGDPTPSLVSEAVIGTRLPLAELETRIYAVAALLLQAAQRGTPHVLAVPLVPPAKPKVRVAAAMGGLLRHVWHCQQARLRSEAWNVGAAPGGLTDLLAHGLPAIAWARPQPGTGLADPFAWPDTRTLLAEEIDCATGHGRIVSLTPDPQAGWRRDRIVLGGAAHYSYPYAIRLDGETLLLPEDTRPGGTTLYRLLPNAGLTPLCQVAPGRRLADPTLFEHDGRYWIAAGDLAVGAHDNLCLFHATGLEGPWRPHRRDPVRIDIRNARPAGTPFHHQGRLYRPAQDCARTYGAAVTINLVERLDPFEFIERPVRTLHPDPEGPYPDGLHTLSVADGYLLVDGKRLVVRPGAVLAKLSRKARRPRHG